MSMPGKQLYEFGPFRLDPIERLLLRDGDPVPLEPKVFDTLVLLVRDAGHLFGKEELISRVWPDAFVEESSLSRNISILRRALGDDGREPRYIETVPRHGYRFVAEVREAADGLGAAGEGGVAETPPSGAPPEGNDPPSPRPAYDTALGPAARRASVFALVVPLTLAVAVAGAYLYRGGGRSVAGEQAPISSIAVLPFVNAGPQPEGEHLSEGISEELINRLSQLPQLKVIARSSSFRYKGREADAREVGRALGVGAVVMGKVVQRGDALQVSVELVRARDNTQLWGAQYARPAKDLQAVQEEMARTISERLRLRLTEAQAQRLTRRATENAQAYQFYLDGLYYSRKGVGFENIKRALDCYSRAVALDAEFALAWVGIANVHLSLAGLSVLDPKEALPKAKAAAERALELDETLAEAHSVLAGIKQDEWDWAGAERGHRRAVELSNLVDAHHRYARFLSVMGRHTEALAEVKRAQGLDPLRVGLRLREGTVLYIARRYEEAAERLRHVIELEPDHAVAHSMLGLTYEARGMYEQAIQAQQKAISIERETTEAQIFLGYALARSGRKSEARAVHNELNSTDKYVSPAMLAILYLGLGDKEGAIASLERAYAAHDLQMQYLKVTPHFDSLRSDPRFQEIVRKVGFPQ